MGLPNDYRDIPVVAGPRSKWTMQVQLDFDGRSLRATVQGSNFPLEGNTTGMQPPGIYNAVGIPYYDARFEPGGTHYGDGTFAHSVSTFVVETYELAAPTDYLTDPKTGLPSGITRAGAMAVGYVESVATVESGGDLSAAGGEQYAAQLAIDQAAVDAGLPTGPGGGTADDEYLAELRDFQVQEARRLAAEMQTVASGGLPDSFKAVNVTDTSQNNTNVSSVSSFDLTQGLLLVVAIFAVLKLLKVV